MVSEISVQIAAQCVLKVGTMNTGAFQTFTYDSRYWMFPSSSSSIIGSLLRSGAGEALSAEEEARCST